MNIIRKLMCALGLHQRVWSEKWTPSGQAEIVTEYEYKAFCLHCRKVFFSHHLKWNGEDMVEVHQ